MQTVTCKICNKTVSSKGFNGHITVHNENVESYVEKYGEYRKNSLLRDAKLKKSVYFCEICKSQHISERELTYHIKMKHNLEKSEYVLQYIFKDDIQYCNCGCGAPVKLLNRYPYRSAYKPGHNPNGMQGKLHNNTTKKVMRLKAIQRNTDTAKKDTSLEIKFEQFLINNELSYKKQVKTEFGSVDFFVENKYYVEIDGDYWHPLQLTNLNLQLIQSAINDYRKNSNIPNLIRIRGSDLDYITNWDDVIELNSVKKYPCKIMNYRDVIIAKEYLMNHHISGNSKVLKTAPSLLLSFIRTFQIEFPKYETSERLETIVSSISQKSETVYDSNSNYYNNNCSNLGTGYLKSLFYSYWKSSYKGNKSPIDIWDDDKMMLSIIKYRIGINQSNETFNFSLHQLIRGISAIRGTISFFKPVLAYAIYKKYLGDIESPVVLDPCAGFGGRMLGFKSAYPNGTYIGVEPNIETYNELVALSKNFSNVKLYNCKFEDFQVDSGYDMIFTSIPYYDLETYSNPVEYSDIAEWEDTFVTSIKKLKGAIINIPLSLQSKFPDSLIYSYIKSNASHLSSKSQKIELLIAI